MSAVAEPVISVIPRRNWTARLFSLPTVLGLLLVAQVFLLTGIDRKAVPAMADPDIWWHLRDASLLLNSGHFIRADSLAFTTAGKPWINFEWMGDLPYYFAYRWFGDSGVYLLMTLLAGLIVAGIYRLSCLRAGDCKAAFLASIVGFYFTTVSLAPRTLLFGWLFLVLELGILWSFEKGRDATAWLPPLFLVWINTHGSWLIGFVMMLVFFASGLVQGKWGSVYATRWTREQWRKILAVAGASFALLFVNPYGWRLVAYPLDVAFQQKQTLRWITEWASLDFHSARGKIVLATLLLMAVMQLVRRRSWSLQDLAFAVIAVYGALTYVRFVFLAGIVLSPFLAMDLEGLLLARYQPEKDRRSINIAVIAVLLALLVKFYPSAEQLHVSIAETFPERALPYLRTIAGNGRVFNSFEWGAYLEWQVPQMKEFIDSRADIFAHEGVMEDYVKAIEVRDTPGVLDRYRIRYVIVPQGFPAAALLQQLPAWRRSYEDGQTVVFERVAAH